MTPEQTKNYEEAAKKYALQFGGGLASRSAFKDVMVGCELASQDTEERVKQAHNAAIDKALAIVNDAYTFDREDKIFAIEDEIQKLKL